MERRRTKRREIDEESVEKGGRKEGEDHERWKQGVGVCTQELCNTNPHASMTPKKKEECSRKRTNDRTAPQEQTETEPEMGPEEGVATDAMVKETRGRDAKNTPDAFQPKKNNNTLFLGHSGTAFEHRTRCVKHFPKHK
eukprot:TRINITY_DN64951_c2_g1_i1.p2 TRINITY_DN64951_c2_g1~~TRINITY_DN64951_c2_g1_i1.p2  ORF type:complete len:139 (-),score=23.15 TRINITY_DN64951_c2_g1_i1:38-454(-)